MSRLARHLGLQRRADPIIQATRLVLLWSRLLIPESPPAPEATENAVNWVPNPAERTAMRAAASWLDAKPRLDRDVFVAQSGPEPTASRATWRL